MNKEDQVKFIESLKSLMFDFKAKEEDIEVVMNLLPSSSGGGSSGGDVFSYSEGEQMTNEIWVDGRPIYVKVIKIPPLQNYSLEIPHNIVNLDKVIYYQGIFYDGDNDFFYSTDYMGVRIEDSSTIFITRDKIYINANERYWLVDNFLILKYTKN